MFKVPTPDLQVDFAATLRELRRLYLQDALNETVRSLSVPEIDRELAAHVSPQSLSTLAGHGLRGEMMFPVPIVLRAKPQLLGYYRLLYGYSQKEFYTSSTGLGRFKSMEDRGIVAIRNDSELESMCDALCEAGGMLLSGIGPSKISAQMLYDLTLLTLGPQLRGGANVKRGTAGIRTVFNVIQNIVSGAIVSSTETRMEIVNAAGRKVLIEFAADPDIVIREAMTTEYRKLIAIEIKAGSDFSNIHNRIGEAEKSHQKARQAGFVECWTVVNVDKLDERKAHNESPTTNRLYRQSDLVRGEGRAYEDFRDRVISLTGIRKILPKQPRSRRS